MTSIERKVDRIRRALVAYGLETPGQVAVKDLTDLLRSSPLLRFYRERFRNLWSDGV